MKVFACLLVFFALIGSAVAWDKEDHEIFDIVSALEAAEGKGTTFYSFLGIPATSSVKEIAKAYKTLSVTMHPDKNPNVKGIAERFARLGTISGILRKEDSRKRYDFFYKNGVPKWKGTGYFYSRWRPGFFTVLVFLGLLTSLFQHLFRTLNHTRDIKRITDLIAAAQSVAWTTPASKSAGPDAPRVPVTTKDAKKKVTVPLGGGGRTVECMVMREGDVYLLDPPSEPTLLTPSTAVGPAPKYTDTWPFTLVRSFTAVKHVADEVLEGEIDNQAATPAVTSPEVSEGEDEKRMAVAGGKKEKKGGARRR